MSFNEGNTLLCALFFIKSTLDSSYGQDDGTQAKQISISISSVNDSIHLCTTKGEITAIMDIGIGTVRFVGICFECSLICTIVFNTYEFLSELRLLRYFEYG